MKENIQITEMGESVQPPEEGVNEAQKDTLAETPKEEVSQNAEQTVASQVEEAQEEEKEKPALEEEKKDTPKQVMEKGAKEESQEDKAQEKAEWFAKDRDNFYKEYPENNLNELLEDDRFLRFAGGRVGVQPMSKIYKDYTEILQELRVAEQEKARKEQERRAAKAQASPGSLTEVASSPVSEYYTIEEIRKMTAEQIDSHWEKVQRSIQRAKK